MQITHFFSELLGLTADAKSLSFTQIAFRGILVFAISLLILRIADRRFMGKLSAFDTLLGFILASVLARAINGSCAFFPTLGGAFVLVILHRFLAAAAFRWEKFGLLIKGRPITLAQAGSMNLEKMRQSQITQEDLLEEGRLNGQVGSLDKISLATLERSGQVSVLPIGK